MHFQNTPRRSATKVKASSKNKNPLDAKVQTLIKAYRDYGHTAADLDPLGIAEKVIHSDLHKTESLFNGDELSSTVNCNFPIGSNAEYEVNNLIDELKEIYCKNIGIEFQHISNKIEKDW